MIDWNGAAVRVWLERRIVAARTDQVAAERRGREGHDDCDVAAAAEMVCTLLKGGDAADARSTFVHALKALLKRDDYVWRGVYDDRPARAHLHQEAVEDGNANDGFGNVRRYQEP